MPARTPAPDHQAARARQVRGFWRHLNALEVTERTPLQSQSLRMLEKDAQLWSKIDILLMEDLSTRARGSSPDPEPWPGTWESNPNSLRAHLRWISKWSDQRLGFGKHDGDLTLLPLSPPSPFHPGTTATGDRQAKGPGADTSRNARSRKAVARIQYAKLAGEQDISDDELSHPSSPAAPSTYVSQRGASESRGRRMRHWKLPSDTDDELGQPSPTTMSTAQDNNTGRGDAEKKGNWPRQLSDILAGDDDDNELGQPSPATVSTAQDNNTGRGDAEKKGNGPRQLCDIMADVDDDDDDDDNDDLESLLLPASAPPGISSRSGREAGFGKLYQVSDSEFRAPVDTGGGAQSGLFWRVINFFV
ncbi:hypothetical protein QBC39DRAFT_376993 [Podospora conica]|nr:hypothetical protein QBC39DRAFT_376993 [Schizothecium conicum]